MAVALQGDFQRKRVLPEWDGGVSRRAPAPTAPAAPAPRPQPTNPPGPVPVFQPKQNTNTNWSPPSFNSSPLPSGGGGGGGGAAAIKPPSPENYLAGDDAYQIQKLALETALKNYLAQSDADTNNYRDDFKLGLSNLGFSPGVNDPETKNVNEALTEGVWNRDDMNTASGRAVQNQQNDFAGRGMLQSSGFADAVKGLMRALGEQFTGMDSARTKFEGDQTRARTSYTTENTAAQGMAKSDALSRLALQYGTL